MYNFIDVTETSESVLPSEALKINGEFIENMIPGYRTLNVVGREALSPDVSSFTTGIRDGSRLKVKRYPERIIIVTYQIIAESNTDFRAAYNQLGRILDVENAELIFNDEDEKFYIGTPCIIDDVDPGRNAVVGKFEILCTDPFKYSVVEYEAEPAADENFVLIDYNGTYKAFPTLEANFYNETEVAEDGVTAGTLTGAGDCGYVAFFNEGEKIIQLGDPDETDTEGTFPRSQTLINQTFMGSTAWGTTARNLWAVNDGHLQSNAIQTGSVGMAVATYEETEPGITTGTLLENAKSTSGSPIVYYTVKAKTHNRTENTVDVTFTITTSLAYTSSYIGKSRVIVGSVYIGGAWHDVTLKRSTEYWKGKSGHTSNITVTVTGLASNTTALTGIKFKAYRSDDLGTSGILGETACANLAVKTYAESIPTNYFLTAASYGTDPTHWHGPSITRQIGEDSAGVVGAVNYTLTYRQKMCMGDDSNATTQLGGFEMHLVDENGGNVAGVRIYKHQAGKTGKLVFYVNGNIVNTTDIDLHYNNYYFGASVDAVQTTTVTKQGNTVTFAVGDYKRQFVDDAIADVVTTGLTFSFEQYPGSTFLAYNGLYWAKFVKNNCDTTKDIPNKFSANDVVEADCKNGEIYLNGVQSPQLGALGNDWEHFYLTPGLNQIGIAYSTWCENAPAFKVRYREVFL